MISVCIPTYNRPDLISRAIDSVLSQNYDDYELLIHDNSEDTRTEEVVLAYNDSRITYKRHKKNIGLNGNWNSLIKCARSEYIKFLNDDDILLPDCLSTLVKHVSEVNKLNKKPIGVVSMKAEYYNTNNGHTKIDRTKHIGGDRVYLVDAKDVPLLWCIDGIPLRTPTHMAYHRESMLEIGGFDNTFRYSRDVFLALKIASKNGALIIDNKPYVRFFIHTGQDVELVDIYDRIENQIRMKKFAYDLNHINIFIPSLKSQIGEICIRECLLMLRAKKYKSTFKAIKFWLYMAYGLGILRFLDSNVLRIRNIQKYYKVLDNE